MDKAASNYHVVRRTAISDLMDAIDIFISEGWVPQGGVAIVVREKDYVYHQAMIRAQLILPAPDTKKAAKSKQL